MGGMNMNENYENDDVKQEATSLSVRTSPENVKKFKELSKELSINHGALFSNLLSAFELDQAKSVFPEREKEIDAFQATAKTLTSMFMHSLEVNQSVEEKIRTEFRLELNASTQTINTLHEQLRLKKEEWDSEKLKYQERDKEYEVLISQMNEKQKQLDLYESQLADKSKEILDKDKRIISLEKMLENQHEELDVLKASLKELPNMKMELQALSNENFKYSIKVESLEQKLDLANEALRRRELESKEIQESYKSLLQQKSDDYQERLEELRALKQVIKNLEAERLVAQGVEEPEETVVQEQSNSAFTVTEDGFVEFRIPQETPVEESNSTVSDDEDDDFEMD